MPLKGWPIGMDRDDVYLMHLDGTQGDSWWMQLDFTDDGSPLNFTDAAARLQVRDDNRDVVLTFDSAGTPPTITVLETLGSIILEQDSVTTAAVTPDTYTYDLQVTEQPTLEFQSGGWVNVGDIPEVNSAAAFTLSWWARTDVAGANYLLGGKGGSYIGLYVYANASGDFTVCIDDGDYGVLSAYTSLITLGKWHHYAVVYSGAATGNAARCILYIDGTARTLSFTGTIPATTADLSGMDALISTAAPGWWGAVRDFRVYSAALSAASIYKLAHLQAYTTGMVHQYLLAEGAGATATDTGSNPMDGAISTLAEWVTPTRTYLRGDFVVKPEVTL